MNVNGHDHGLLAVLLEELGKFDCSSRLTCTLETIQYDRRKARGGYGKLGFFRTEEFDQGFPYDLDDLLARCQAAHDIGTQALPAHFINEFLGYLIVNVSFKESHADLAGHLLKVSFSYTGLPAHLAGYVLQFCRQTLKHLYHLKLVSKFNEQSPCFFCVLLIELLYRSPCKIFLFIEHLYQSEAALIFFKLGLASLDRIVNALP